MSNQYRKRRDLAGIVYLPDGSTLTDPNRVLTGARFARYCPEFLEEVKDEDQSKLLTEDLPETGTGRRIYYHCDDRPRPGDDAEKYQRE